MNWKTMVLVYDHSYGKLQWTTDEKKEELVGLVLRNGNGELASFGPKGPSPDCISINRILNGHLTETSLFSLSNDRLDTLKKKGYLKIDGECPIEFYLLPVYS